MSSENPDTRTRILKSALDLLEQGGGSAVRMSDIAKRAGVSRQAVYLHFPGRADLLIAATRYLDEVLKIDDRLAQSRAATSGRERLAAYVAAWGDYIPEIQGVAKALMAMQATDQEAAQAWSDRMDAMRQGCAAAVEALARDGDLRAGLSAEVATDLLWTMLSVENWAQLRGRCGWSQADYRARIHAAALATLTG